MSEFLTPPFIISILIALSVHEWAHAYAAYKLGDPTAKYEGRLTLNPLAHLDPIGTLMFVVIGFGWGKPVPVDPRYFKNYKRDNAIVAFAGPLSNFVLAWIFFFILILVSDVGIGNSIMGLLGDGHSANPVMELIAEIAAASVFVNLALMAFNLLPVAPLDGSKVIHPFIPAGSEVMYHEYLRRGPILLLLIIVAERAINFPLLSGWVFGLIAPVLAMMNGVAGMFL